MDCWAASSGRRTVSEPRHVQVALFASRWPEKLLPTIVSLRAALPGVRLVLGSPTVGDTSDALSVDEVVRAQSVAELINFLWRRSDDHILVVGDTVIVPPAFLDLALPAVQDDMRVATVSFLSNSAEHLSFPTRNAPSLRGIDGTDEVVITRRLRDKAPESGMAPIAFPGGAVVLVSAYALGVGGGMISQASGSMDSMLADFSLRLRRRGFVDLLDAGTYVTRPPDLSIAPERTPSIETVDGNALLVRHPSLKDFLARELTSTTSPMALAHATARAKVAGLSVVIEGRCLGPLEMGTQVHTVALIKALAERDDVARVGVALAGPVPVYAQEVLRGHKVEPRITAPSDFSSFGPVDIVHRPYQPDAVDVHAWRSVAARTLVTMQDLIAYHIGAYHQTGAAWLAYRDSVQAAARAVDGVVVFSADTARQLARESFPVDSSRVFVVPCGTDHLSGTESARVPAELVARGAGGKEFVLILGANYAHKNRDVGIQAWRHLRDRGWGHSLVLAGAYVGHGSSRLEEAAGGGSHADIVTIPDVPTDERNWLLRNASVLLYPTSAEGFGLVPYEAAMFGTPTVAIPFGPLLEVNPAAPVWSGDWASASVADAAQALLRDPGVARDQVAATVAAGAAYTWEYAAGRLVEAYRTLLDRPARESTSEDKCDHRP
jgi:glycosyltransferase involved in cell wall biosynthesis